LCALLSIKLFANLRVLSKFEHTLKQNNMTMDFGYSVLYFAVGNFFAISFNNNYRWLLPVGYFFHTFNFVLQRLLSNAFVRVRLRWLQMRSDQSIRYRFEFVRSFVHVRIAFYEHIGKLVRLKLVHLLAENGNLHVVFET